MNARKLAEARQHAIYVHECLTLIIAGFGGTSNFYMREAVGGLAEAAKALGFTLALRADDGVFIDAITNEPIVNAETAQ